MDQNMYTVESTDETQLHRDVQHKFTINTL